MRIEAVLYKFKTYTQSRCALQAKIVPQGAPVLRVLGITQIFH